MARRAPPSSTRRRAARRVACAWSAALLLVLWQSFALFHGVVHPHAGGGSRVAAAIAAVAPAAADPLHHDDGSSLCRLIDHFAQPDALPVAVLLLAAALPRVAIARAPRAGRSIAAPSAYAARAPPVLRHA